MPSMAMGGGTIGMQLPWLTTLMPLYKWRPISVYISYEWLSVPRLSSDLRCVLSSLGYVHNAHICIPFHKLCALWVCFFYTYLKSLQREWIHICCCSFVLFLAYVVLCVAMYSVPFLFIKFPFWFSCFEFSFFNIENAMNKYDVHNTHILRAIKHKVFR